MSPKKLKKKHLNKSLTNTHVLTAIVLYINFVQHKFIARNEIWGKELRKGLIYQLCCQHYI